MSKTHKDKNQTPHPESLSFEEKKRAAYSKMGQLGGMARAKQMAEQGFTPKTNPNAPSQPKSPKESLAKNQMTTKQGSKKK
jgi:hypothetical protein